MILPEAACAAVAGCGAAGAGGESGAVPSTDVRPAGGAAGRFSIVGGAMLGVSVDAGRGALFGAGKGITRRADLTGAGGRRDGGSVSGRGGSTRAHRGAHETGAGATSTRDVTGNS